jgi:hypothetical protein
VCTAPVHGFCDAQGEAEQHRRAHADRIARAWPGRHCTAQEPLQVCLHRRPNRLIPTKNGQPCLASLPFDMLSSSGCAPASCSTARLRAMSSQQTQQMRNIGPATYQARRSRTTCTPAAGGRSKCCLLVGYHIQKMSPSIGRAANSRSSPPTRAVALLSCSPRSHLSSRTCSRTHVASRSHSCNAGT